MNSTAALRLTSSPTRSADAVERTVRPNPGSSTSTILIVDDTPENLSVLTDLLQPDYRVRAAISGTHALRIASSEPKPDLVLLDVMMPGMDGREVLARLSADPATAGIPVIFVTAMDSASDEEAGLELGAVDYITKPFVPRVVLARVRTQLELKRARDILADQNAWLEAEVARRMRENELIQDVSIHVLARLAEARDAETGNHLRRTQGYVRTLSRHLRSLPRYAAYLDDRTIDILVKSAPLHDIGKVGIPDSILLKPGPLTPEEWQVMRMHTVIGSEAIESAGRDVERPVEFLAVAREIARSHHERWDGKGYPDGLAGEAIPRSARLMALADVFDALISKRVYKEAYSFELAKELIVDGRGTQFDPDVVDAFLAGYDGFVATARRFSDGTAEHGAQRWPRLAASGTEA